MAAPRIPALAALFAGAVAIATAPIFVRLSEVGPVATAFWRMALALPALGLWAASTDGLRVWPPGRRWALLAAGLFFAGDLAVWHWSIRLTSVANSTLLANCAPIFVTLAAWLLWRLRPSAAFLAGMAAALAGVVVLARGSAGFGAGALLGDALGIATAMFYAAYQLTVSRARTHTRTATLMFWSSLACGLALLPAALLMGEQIVPRTLHGWLVLAGLALAAQVAGQSLIAYAFAHLPATFSSVGLLLQPVAAAGFAWVLLDEPVGSAQALGGALVLAGILLARRAAGRSA